MVARKKKTRKKAKKKKVTKPPKISRKLELEQNAVALACQRELVLQAARRMSMNLPPEPAETIIGQLLAQDAKLQRMERARNRLLTVRRPNCKKKGG